MVHYHYQEWSVLLRSEWRGEAAWFCLTIPVSKWMAKAAGRYLGFPKYIADEICLTKSGENWHASAKYKGVEQVLFEFCPGLNRPITDWESELLEEESLFGDEKVHLLVPPGKGPRAQKVTLRHAVQPKWSPQPGMVSLQVYPGEPWAGLVPYNQELTGTYNRYNAGMNLIAERLN